MRLTASGLGCPKWPGCEGATKLPARDHYQQIEFSNRLISGVTILLTLVTWLASRWTPTMPTLGAPRCARDVPRRARAGAARRDHRLLRPQSVARALALPALGRAADARRDRGARGVERPRRRAAAAAARSSALLVGVACAALVVTGTFATAAGRVPGQLRREADPAARVVPAGDVAARPRDGHVRRSRSPCCSSGSRDAASRHLRCALAAARRARAPRWRSARSSTGSTCPGGSCSSTSRSRRVWAATVAFVARFGGPGADGK